jgi:DNA invertase Pin-like site-specific DNA recombinase
MMYAEQMKAIAYIWWRWESEPGPSPSEQEDRLRNAAEAGGWSITRFARDDRTTARAARRRALREVAREHSDALVACDLASLVSSSRDFTRFFSAAAEQSVRVVVMDSGIDLATADGQLVSRVAAELANADLALWQRHASESTQARRGRKPMPKQIRNKILTLHREKDMSYGGIASYLNSQGVPTSQKGQRWYRSTVKAVVDSWGQGPV